jgi:hypothetical protein
VLWITRPLQELARTWQVWLILAALLVLAGEELPGGATGGTTIFAGWALERAHRAAGPRWWRRG